VHPPVHRPLPQAANACHTRKLRTANPALAENTVDIVDK